MKFTSLISHPLSKPIQACYICFVYGVSRTLIKKPAEHEIDAVLVGVFRVHSYEWKSNAVMIPEMSNIIEQMKINWTVTLYTKFNLKLVYSEYEVIMEGESLSISSTVYVIAICNR